MFWTNQCNLLKGGKQKIKTDTFRLQKDIFCFIEKKVIIQNSFKFKKMFDLWQNLM